MGAGADWLLLMLQLGEERKEKLDLIKIVSAHTQVVAGTNYKLLLDVAGASNKLEHVEATVYGAAFPP